MLLLLPLAIVWAYHADHRAQAGIPLDGGLILVTTALIYVATFAGSYFSLFQLRIAQWMGLPGIAIQVSVPILVLWIVAVLRRANTDDELSGS